MSRQLIAHVVPDDKFTDMAIRQLEQSSPGIHLYFSIAAGRKYRYVKSDRVVDLEHEEAEDLFKGLDVVAIVSDIPLGARVGCADVQPIQGAGIQRRLHDVIFLLSHLADIAIRNGISGLTAEVLVANRAMQHVFNKSEYAVTSAPTQDVISFRIDFA